MVLDPSPPPLHLYVDRVCVTRLLCCDYRKSTLCETNSPCANRDPTSVCGSRLREWTVVNRLSWMHTVWIDSPWTKRDSTSLCKSRLCEWTLNMWIETVWMDSQHVVNQLVNQLGESTTCINVNRLSCIDDETYNCKWLLLPNLYIYKRPIIVRSLLIDYRASTMWIDSPCESTMRIHIYIDLGGVAISVEVVICGNRDPTSLCGFTRHCVNRLDL